jgi:hypothetical protein
MSFPKDWLSVYASLISLYVTPPAMNIIIRCLPSVFVARAEGALCHVGLADLREPEEGGGAFGDKKGDEDRCIGATSGASLTYGNRF